MKYILIGGSQNVGKTEAIYHLANYLLNSRSFVDVLQSVPKTKRDFMAILEGKDKNRNNIRIAINSASDTPDIIRKFKTLLNENKNISIIISSIRDNNFYPRKEFFDILNIDENDIDIEIPLAKITRRRKNKEIALKWYKNKINLLIIKLLEKIYL